uniref:cell envelope integrity TolA C-terminal domain-containing protein n=1 Tax=Escherichia coli TaxID=562 RepID=UPI001CC0E764
SLKTSIKTITYLSDIGCLEIQGASLESGDLDLCREAMNAIKNADIPAPPSPEVYKVFQNGVLDFKP